MLQWIIQITFISIILIFLVHHLIHFFKSTLTVPKVKDLVNIPAQKYDHIFNILSKNNYENNNMINNNNEKININQSTNINNLPVVGDDMKNELKKFLKQQMTDNVYNS